MTDQLSYMWWDEVNSEALKGFIESLTRPNEVEVKAARSRVEKMLDTPRFFKGFYLIPTTEHLKPEYLHTIELPHEMVHKTTAVGWTQPRN